MRGKSSLKSAPPGNQLHSDYVGALDLKQETTKSDWSVVYIFVILIRKNCVIGFRTSCKSYMPAVRRIFVVFCSEIALIRR